MTDLADESPDAALLRIFGFAGFQPGQRPVVQSVIDGVPTVAIMPTGAGKSLCYQLPGAMFDGLTLVVSPLIALMRDQVDGLEARGLSAAALNSHKSAAEQRDILERAVSGRLQFLYVAPERLALPAFMEQLARTRVALLAIDEAHCISQWGHDFRPDYRRIRDAIDVARPQRILACTATATPEVKDDIVRSLGLQDPAVFVSGFLRTNLFVEVRTFEKLVDRDAAVVAAVQAQGDDGAVIVYANSRKRVEAIGERLAATLAEPVTVYHAGMAPAERSEAQDRFMCGVSRVAVATNAFGMGVDRGDVRAVVHAGMPRTVEAYYQEIGRAGRDRAPSRCIMLYHSSDSRVQEFLIEQSDSPEFRQLELRKLEAMRRYVFGTQCRHRAILRYFGERWSGECPGCDQCDPNRTMELRLPASSPAGGRRPSAVVAPSPSPGPRDVDVARRALAGVARAGEAAPIGAVAAMLAGDEDDAAVSSRLRALTTFGVLSGTPPTQCAAYLRRLVAMGALRPSADGGLALTPLGAEIMRATAALPAGLGVDAPTTRDRGAPARERSKAHTAAGARVVADRTADTPADATLREALRRWRRERAGIAPAFTVCSDRTLDAIVAARPTDRASFLAVSGLGEGKWLSWGPELLAVVAEAGPRG